MLHCDMLIDRLCCCCCCCCCCCDVCLCICSYQGVDWSRPSSWECNRRWDPAGPGDFSYDGIALDPMEVRVG
jgi:hypothetical protein